MKTVILFSLMLIICIFGAASWLSANQDLEITQAEIAHYQAELGEANHQLKSANTEISNLEFTVDRLENRIRAKDEVTAELEASNKRLEKINYDLQRKAKPREFRSIAELEAWLASYNEKTIYLNAGNGSFNSYDCDDMAVAMMKAALKNGYLMSWQLVDNGWHMICSTMIGNEGYYIEPSTKEYWLEFHRDPDWVDVKAATAGEGNYND